MGQNSSTISTKRNIISIKKRIPTLKVEGIDLKKLIDSNEIPKKGKIVYSQNEIAKRLAPLNQTEALQIIAKQTKYKRPKNIVSIYTHDGEESGIVFLNGNILHFVSQSDLQEKKISLQGLRIYGKDSLA